MNLAARIFLDNTRQKPPVCSNLEEMDIEFDILHSEGLLPSFCCSRFAISSLQAGRTWLPCVSL